MRIWSLHPKYLDTKGLVALWREALLAKNVIDGKTKGYKNHPQLKRFKESSNPIDSINQYLSEIYKEALKRKYNFDKRKINWNFKPGQLTLTTGQVNYEVEHLLNKLRKRDPQKYNKLKSTSTFAHHPIFKLVKGEIEEWEIAAFL